MADLIETSVYPAAITRIETNEPVVGGEDGVSNRALKQLGNRTRWLLDSLNALSANLGNLYALKTGDYTTLRARATTKADVGLALVENFAPSQVIGGGSASLVATTKAVADALTGLQSGGVFTSPGYVTLGSGLIIQWGIVDASIVPVVQLYPITFPTKVLTKLATAYFVTTDNSRIPVVGAMAEGGPTSALERSQISIRAYNPDSGGDPPGQAFWAAVGH